MKENNIEVEVRGPLNSAELSDLKGFLKREGRHIENKERVLIDFSTCIDKGGMQNRDLDIRIRVTNDIPEIIVKKGKWGATDSRKEISFKGTKNQFSELVEIFALLGYPEGMLCLRNIDVYVYKGIEFALVEIPNHSNMFEAEIITNPDDSDHAKKRILKVCKELGLTAFNGDEFFSYMEKLNREANRIFNFHKYPKDYFKDK